MKKFTWTLNKLKQGVFLFIIATFVALTLPHGARADTSLVPDTDTINPSIGNSFYAELSDIRAGSNLQADQSYAMLSYSTNGDSFFRIGYCTPNVDRGCVSGPPSTPTTDAADVEIYVCALEESPTSPETETKYRIKDESLSGACQRFIQPQQGTDYKINVKAERANTNGRYNYMALVQFYGGADAATNAAIPFRLRAKGGTGNTGTAGFFPYQRMDRTGDLTRFMVKEDAYLAIQNRNATYNQSGTTHKDQIKITMRADCLVDPTRVSNPGFKLRWNDADAKPGSVPDNSDPNGIYWKLKNLDTGQELSSNQRAFWNSKSHADYLGGQDEPANGNVGFDFIPYGSDTSGAYGTFYYRPGQRIEWSWYNVLANNGVNLQVPFDDYNIGGQCPVPVNSARCDVSGVPDTIMPDETKKVIIRVRNGNFAGKPATTTWPVGGPYRLASGVYPVPTGQTPSDNAAYIDSPFWNAATIPPPNTKNTVTGSNRVLLTETIYPQNLEPSKQSLATFEFNITAPADKSGDFPFVWQMVQDGKERFGEVCSKSIKIIENRPILRVEGSDVMAGAVFGINGAATAESCSNKRQQYTAAGDIKTNGLDVETGYNTGLWAGWHGFSSSQYAAFAKSEVASGKNYSKNNFSANDGYMRGSPRYRDLIFANQLSGTNKYGYFYKSSNNTLPCVDTSSLDTAYTPISSGAIGSTTITGSPSNGKVTYYKSSNTNNITLNAISGGEIPINAGQRVVIVTEGSITINARIRYTSLGSPNANGDSNAPLLMLIAKGGIQVSGDVPQLDGYYLAYDSTFNTCSENNRTTTGICGSRLIVNGAVAAKKILWGRQFGTTGGADDSVNSGSTGGLCSSGPGNSSIHAVLTQFQNNGADLKAALNDCSAEYVKFSPEFYFANPFSKQRKPGVSNIPESSTELPPVY